MLELAEADAWASLLGDDVHAVGTAIAAYFPQSRELILNTVRGLGIARGATQDDLDDIAGLYENVEHAITLAPSAEPRNLQSWLEERGYEHGAPDVKLLRASGGREQVETDLRIELIGPELGPSYATVVDQAFGISSELASHLAALPGLPGWSCYLGFDGERPVAAGALHVGPAGGWLGLSGTVAQYRGRGGQSAITAARLERAEELGAELVVTETGEVLPNQPSASYRNMLRQGFKVAYVRPKLVRAAG